MTDRSTVSSRPHLSRRAVAQGAAWAVPAVALTTPAPAFAVSPSLVKGCFDLPLTDITREGTQGQTGSLTGDGAAQGDAVGTLTYTISQGRTSGVPQGPGVGGNPQTGKAVPNETQGDFAVVSGENLWNSVFIFGSPSMKHHSGESVTPLYNNAGGNLLILNQALDSNAMKSSETITFDFGGQVPTSISFAIFDLTRADRGSNAHVDTVSFSSAATVTRVSGPTLDTAGAVNGGIPVYPTAHYPSPNEGPGTRVDVVAAPTARTFSLTYSNTTSAISQNKEYAQSQYIAIGDIKVCF